MFPPAQVSKAHAPPGDVGLYGIRISPRMPHPLLLLAAAVAVDRYDLAHKKQRVRITECRLPRIGDATGIRPISGVYSDSKANLMSRLKRKKSKKTVVTTTAVPQEPAPAQPVVSPPIAVTTMQDLPSSSSRVYSDSAPAVSTIPAPPPPPVAPSPIGSTAGSSAQIPTTPVVKVTTVPQTTGASGTSPMLSATSVPREEIAATEKLPEVQAMEAEKLVVPAAKPEAQYLEKAAYRAPSESVDIPITGHGGLE